MSRITLEVAVDSLTNARIAVESGADRIELSSALELGGLTPSLGLYLAIRDAFPTLPIVVMIRSVPGDFILSADDITVMQRDMSRFLPHSPDTFIFGGSMPDKTVDVKNLEVLRKYADKIPCVFHRAFDEISDFETAIEALIRLGFCRLLSSGGAATAPAGAAILARLQRHYGDRIEILPGCGVRSTNIVSLIQSTKCTQVHGSFSSNDSHGRRLTSADEIRECRRLLDQLPVAK